VETEIHARTEAQPAVHDPHTIRGLLTNLDLLEVQVASIVRGPHLRLLTAREIAELHRKLDEAEARLRDAALRQGLDAAVPLHALRHQLRAGAHDSSTAEQVTAQPREPTSGCRNPTEAVAKTGSR
jgi:hypothetical protein